MTSKIPFNLCMFYDIPFELITCLDNKHNTLQKYTRWKNRCDRTVCCYIKEFVDRGIIEQIEDGCKKYLMLTPKGQLLKAGLLATQELVNENN